MVNLIVSGAPSKEANMNMFSTLWSRITAAVLVVGISILAVALAPSAQADRPHGCSLAHTAGHYGFMGSGTIFADNPFHLPAGPFTTAGTMDLFPDGHWQAQQTVSFNGQVSQASGEGTWSVTPECLFTNASSVEGDTGAGAVVDNGREILLMDSGPGIAATFTLKRVTTKP
jgi:hypothetical protein